MVETLEYVVQPTDVEDASAPPSHRWWITVAARVFPLLATTSKAKRERKAARLRLNGDAAAPTNTLVAVGDSISFTPADAATVCTGAHDMKQSRRRWLEVCARQGMRLVFEDDETAVVVKPVGIHVKGRGHRTVEFALPVLLRASHAESSGDLLAAPHAVHRLDYRVGGLLVVAKSRSAEISLCRQLQAHCVAKRYRAILVGRLDPAAISALSVVAPADIALNNCCSVRDASSEATMYLVDEPIGGKPCCTAVVVRQISLSARYEWLTTVDLWPLTGRWHQLRLHMAHLGHPIVGDDLHHNHGGGDSHAASPTRQEVVTGAGLFLHAVGVSFLDAWGNRRSFKIAEPHKFGRFRHFCELNWRKRVEREAATADCGG